MYRNAFNIVTTDLQIQDLCPYIASFCCDYHMPNFALHCEDMTEDDCKAERDKLLTEFCEYISAATGYEPEYIRENLEENLWFKEPPIPVETWEHRIDATFTFVNPKYVFDKDTEGLTGRYMPYPSIKPSPGDGPLLYIDAYYKQPQVYFYARMENGVFSPLSTGNEDLVGKTAANIANIARKKAIEVELNETKVEERELSAAIRKGKKAEAKLPGVLCKLNELKAKLSSL